MEITDSHIKLLQNAAMVEDAIKLCQDMIAQAFVYEAEIIAKRRDCEKKLGELLAYKAAIASRLTL